MSVFELSFHRYRNDRPFWIHDLTEGLLGHLSTEASFTKVYVRERSVNVGTRPSILCGRRFGANSTCSRGRSYLKSIVSISCIFPVYFSLLWSYLNLRGIAYHILRTACNVMSKQNLVSRLCWRMVTEEAKWATVLSADFSSHSYNEQGAAAAKTTNSISGHFDIQIVEYPDGEKSICERCRVIHLQHKQKKRRIHVCFRKDINCRIPRWREINLWEVESQRPAA